MKKILFMIGCFAFCTLCAAENNCMDIHLKSGDIIRGVQCNYEEAFGTKFVVYWYLGSDQVKRIKATEVHHFKDAECAGKALEPKIPSLKNGTSTQSGQSFNLWKRMIEITRDKNEIRRYQQWSTEVKGRFITLCGNIEKMTAATGKPNLVMTTRGPKNFADEPVSVLAYIPKGRELNLVDLTAGQTVCISGRVVHATAARPNSQSMGAYLFDLDRFLSQNSLDVDFIFEDCVLEK